MCEIQLQTCCECTLCNPGRLKEAAARWRPCRQQRAQITMAWAAAKSWVSAITRPTNTPRAAHGHSSQTLSASRSLALSLSLFQCTQVSGQGLQYTLLATLLYNSYPAPKVEYSNCMHCFIGACKNRSMHVEQKAAYF